MIVTGRMFQCDGPLTKDALLPDLVHSTCACFSVCILVALFEKMCDFVGAKFYCLHALADGSQRICIREKMLEFSSTVLFYTVSVP